MHLGVERETFGRAQMVFWENKNGVLDTHCKVAEAFWLVSPINLVDTV